MEQSELAKIFKALSSEQRLKLFKEIYAAFQEAERAEKAPGKCFCAGIEKAFTHACKHSALARSTISHHFKELQNAGLIHCERKGQAMLCKVNEKIVDHIRNFLK